MFDPAAIAGNLGQLTIDNAFGGSITLMQPSNTLTVSTAIVGYSGSGAILQSGGSQNVGNLYLGFLTGNASGMFTLGPSASLAVSGVEGIGYNGTGTFDQTGGLHSVGSTFFVGINDGAAGTYNQTGGTATLGGDLYLGWSGAGSSGALNLGGNGSLAVSGQEIVGNGGRGIVNQTGGSHSIGSSLILGYNAGASGSYGLSNGAALTVAASEYIGSQGAGAFNQTGGTHTVGGNLYLAFSGGGSSGTYILSGGSASLAVTGTEILAYNGTAVFNHSAGSHTAGTLIIGVNSGASATYNLSGSASLTTNGSEYLGYQGGTGTFNQIGGSHSVGGVLTVVANPASTALYNLAGGTLTASVVNNGTFAQTGGTFNGTLNNYGTFQYGGGTFAGSLVLQPSGAMTLNAPFTAGSGITLVNSAITLGPSAMLAANGAGLENQGGSLSLAGGTVGGNGPIRNSGRITGNGTFGAGGLTNASRGVVSITGGPATFMGSVVNNGSFQVQHGSAAFAAGFTNNGSYVSDPSINVFTDLVNGPSSYIAASDGDQFLVTGSFVSSSRLNTSWDTHSAVLYLQTSANNASHTMDITGADLGKTLTGYQNNFAWGTLEVDPNQTLILQDGNTDPGGALYVGGAQLLGAPSGADLAGYISTYLINGDPANPMNIYYDPSLSGNAYLDAQTYALGNGGVLAPVSVPEPSMFGVLAVTGLGLLRRRGRWNVNIAPNTVEPR